MTDKPQPETWAIPQHEQGPLAETPDHDTDIIEVTFDGLPGTMYVPVEKGRVLSTEDRLKLRALAERSLKDRRG